MVPIHLTSQLMKLGKSVLGEKLFGALMKQTFYGQFVAGENRAAIKPKIAKMQEFGVKSILDYSVEEDMSEEKAQQKELHSTVLEVDQVEDYDKLKHQVEDYDKLKHKGTHKDSIRR